MTSERATFSGSTLVYAVFLMAITLLTYAPVRNYAFVNYDDPQYITENPNVTAGLTWYGIRWAFTTGYQANWHPLTWLSHMLDVQLFGLNPGPHHLVNLVFHITNTILLFLLLIQITGRPGPSLFVAALFAVHPLHVESVAWASERKDVLSTFFGLLTLGVYVRYVRRPRLTTYCGMLGLFALSLMAKPMLVTLPFALLLIDFWPLGRFRLRDLTPVPTLIREKIPLIILSGVSSVVTFIAQKTGGTVARLDTLPITTRIANAFIGYFSYLQRMFWPARLCILYPVRSGQYWWWAAALALTGLSIVAIWTAQRWPYIPVGWFWFMGTLVPVIGLVQVGRQATADRYTYMPLTGLFVIVAFGAGDTIAWLPRRKFVLLIAGGLTIAACMLQARTQLQYWASSETLWSHALTITPENAVAHFNLGTALEIKGKRDEAILHYSEAVRIEPQYWDGQYDLGLALINTGNPEKLPEAANHLSAALRIKPDFPQAHNALGIDYLAQGKIDNAAAEFSEAIRLKPDYASAHNNLGTALGDEGQVDRAISEYSEAVRLDAGLTEARKNLGVLLAKRTAH